MKFLNRVIEPGPTVRLGAVQLDGVFPRTFALVITDEDGTVVIRGLSSIDEALAEAVRRRCSRVI